MRNILIVNWAGLNTGDDAMLYAITHYIRTLIPDANIGIIAHAVSGEIISKLNIHPFGSVFSVESHSNRWKELIKAITWSDAVIVGGGDILRERVASFAPFALAAAYGRPVCGVGIGATERSRSKYWIACYHFFAKCINHLYVRDKNSYSIVDDLFSSQEKKLHIAPDIAFSRLTQSNIHHSKNKYSIVVNLREINDSAYISKDNNNREDLLLGISNLIADINKSKPVDVILVPMVDKEATNITGDTLDDDTVILFDLSKKLLSSGINNTLISSRPRDLETLHQIIGSADLVIGSRYHFIIGALNSQALICCIPYANKVKQLTQLVPGLVTYPCKLEELISSQDIDARHETVSALATSSAAAINSALASLTERPSLKKIFFGALLLALLRMEPVSRSLRIHIGRIVKKSRFSGSPI